MRGGTRWSCDGLVTRLIARRLSDSAIVLLLATVVVFTLLRLLPGDPAMLMLGEHATPQTLANLRASFGLDRPVAVQYGLFLRDAAAGQFGESIRAQRPALGYVLGFFPATLQLATTAVVVTLVVGIGLGVLSAAYRGGVIDALARGLAMLAQSTPNYWLGLMLINVFAVWLHWVPASGRGTPSQLVMPAITLSFVLIGLVLRLTRTEVLDVLRSDYVRTASAKGLGRGAVLFRHVLRNALVPVVTVVGLQLGSLLGGAVVTETVFAWPGIGYLTIQAVETRDYPVLQTIILLAVAAFLLINLAVDLLYAVIDPRIRYE